jgi:predicted nucleotide-binding protein
MYDNILYHSHPEAIRMARRPTKPTPQSPVLTPGQIRRHIEKFQRCIQELEAFDPQKVQKRYSIPEVMALEAAIDEALSAAFGHGTPAYNRYKRAASLDNGPHFARIAFGHGATDYDAQEAQEARKYLTDGKQQSIALLQQAIRTLEDEIADQEHDNLVAVAPLTTTSSAPSRRVFLVHGRDNEAKNEVARFLSKIGLEEIILHERPNSGRHLLTKFQEESEGASFAVVLITPDDEGGLPGEPLRKRARQNVVFELGFFIGRLGPSHVAALVKGDVEKPSDFDGVGYISLDSTGGWKGLLARELKAAKIPFDSDKVFEA